eukprot:6938276-Pyramimonas_sp.AAC.1
MAGNVRRAILAACVLLPGCLTLQTPWVAACTTAWPFRRPGLLLAPPPDPRPPRAPGQFVTAAARP